MTGVHLKAIEVPTSDQIRNIRCRKPQIAVTLIDFGMACNLAYIKHAREAVTILQEARYLFPEVTQWAGNIREGNAEIIPIGR